MKTITQEIYSLMLEMTENTIYAWNDHNLPPAEITIEAEKELNKFLKEKEIIVE